MPSSLRYFKRDPNGLRRGEGVYYLRGKGYYSKYSIGRDRKILAKGHKISKVGVPTRSKILHTSDGRLSR